MNRLTTELVVASISRNPRRFITQAGLVAAVVLAGCGALAVAHSGTDALAQSITASGALRYEVRAVGDPAAGEAVFPLETVDALAAARNVEGAVASAGIQASPTDRSGSGPSDQVGVLAVSAGYLDTVDWTLRAGVDPFDSRALAPERQAVLGVLAAAKFGVTAECVATQACGVVIGGEAFRVASVASFAEPDLDNTVLLDLATAVELGLSQGPKLVVVEAGGLPTADVARNLDQIASVSGRTVVVEAPDTGGALRSGLSETWSSTITVVAIVLMGLGAMAQIAMQLTSIRFRRSEIATLRSLGCTPAAVVAQFTLEPALTAIAGAAIGAGSAATLERVAMHLDLAATLPIAGALAIAAAAVVSTTAASYLAARSTARVAPAEVIGT